MLWLILPLRFIRLDSQPGAKLSPHSAPQILLLPNDDYSIGLKDGYEGKTNNQSS